MVDLSSSPTFCMMNVTEIAESRSSDVIHDWIGTSHSIFEDVWFPEKEL